MCFLNEAGTLYLLSHPGKVQANGFYGNNKEAHSKKSCDDQALLLVAEFVNLINVYFLMLRKS